MESIQPAMQGIGSVINHIANPNWQQQAALRDMILKNPELQQQLVDMGADQVESAYGKGTGKFAQGTVSTEKKMKDMKGAEFQRIMALPVDAPERAEFLANMTGTKTQIEREIQQNSLTAGQLSVKNAQIDSDRENQYRALAKNAIVKTKGQLYRNRGMLSPEELTAVTALQEYNGQYDRDMKADFMERDDRRLAENAARIRNGTADFQQFKMRRAEEAANRIMMKTGTPVQMEAVMAIQNSPLLYKKYLEMKKPPTSEQELGLYNVAQGLKSIGGGVDDTARRAAMYQFKSVTGGLIKIINDKNSSPAQKMNAIESWNNTSDALLSEKFNYQPPQMVYDKEGTGTKNSSFAGMDMSWAQGKDVRLVVGAVNGGQVQSRTDAEISGAASLIASDPKKYTLDGAIETMTVEDGQKLKAKVDSLTKPKPETYSATMAPVVVAAPKQKTKEIPAKVQPMQTPPDIKPKPKLETTGVGGVKPMDAIGNFNTKEHYNLMLPKDKEKRIQFLEELIAYNESLHVDVRDSAKKKLYDLKNKKVNLNDSYYTHLSK